MHWAGQICGSRSSLTAGIADPPILSSSANTGTALYNRPTIGLEQDQAAAECVSSTRHWLSNRQVRAESRFSVFLRSSSFLSRLMW